MKRSLCFRFLTIVPERLDTASTRVWRGPFSRTDSPANVTNSARWHPGPERARAAESRRYAGALRPAAGISGAPVRCGRVGARSWARAPGRAGSKARAMEQRLAEFRAARKRTGLAAEPSALSQSAQTSGEKAEAAATPKPVLCWLKQFLVWKPRPASVRAQPILAQVRGRRPRPGNLAAGPPSWPQWKLRLRPRPPPFTCSLQVRPGGGAAPPTRLDPQATPLLVLRGAFAGGGGAFAGGGGTAGASRLLGDGPRVSSHLCQY